jgi:hypothetical protein
MTATETTDRTIQMRARAFTGGKVAMQACQVSDDGTVRVWDDVAGHYTTCHILSDADLRRARQLAEAKGPVLVCEVGANSSHDAALAKSVGVDVLKVDGRYRLRVTHRSRWEGEEPAQVECPAESYATLDDARSEAESICASRYGDPVVRRCYRYCSI